ncbi:MAG TPA: hypothetical protein VGJ61_10835 [Solirubrobacterales bacterium]
MSASGGMPIFGNDSLALGLGASRGESAAGVDVNLDHQLRF